MELGQVAVDGTLQLVSMANLESLEPPRVPWRLHFLRGWSHDEEDVEPVFA